MLARALRTIGLLALAAMAIWAWICVETGRPLAALAGPLLAVALQASVLGIEFVLLHLLPRGPDEPRAKGAQVVRAWIGEVRASIAVFWWRQPLRSRTRQNHLPPDAQGRRGVLLIHGFVCNRGIWLRWLDRLRAADVPFVAVDLEPVFGSIDAYAPIIEAAVRRLEQATGLAPIAVAHSMGGLALRAWWRTAGDHRVHRALTLGTPHHGTWIAQLGHGPNAAQMRRDSKWLKALAAAEPPARAARFTCLYSECDNIVFPPTTATLAGAANRRVPGVGHVQLVDSEPAWQAMAELLGLAVRAG